MDIEKFSIQSCCGKKSTIYKIDRPIDNNLLVELVGLGFTELKHFTAAGILYVDNSSFIITGPIGSNRLQVKCKRSNCDQILEDFEVQLKKIK
jgi:hypothetical protein